MFIILSNTQTELIYSQNHCEPQSYIAVIYCLPITYQQINNKKTWYDNTNFKPQIYKQIINFHNAETTLKEKGATKKIKMEITNFVSNLFEESANRMDGIMTVEDCSKGSGLSHV